jgi:hypothetical protein
MMRTAGLSIGLVFLLCGSLMAADGDLIVNGNIGVGKTPAFKLDVNGIVSVNANPIKNVAAPSDANDAATKDYVDVQLAANTGPRAALRKKVFVTSTTYNGNLGGLTGADAKCQARADAAALGGTWKAILSDGTTDARDRMGYGWDYLNTTNGRIVVSVGDLWRCTYDNLGAAICLNSPINMDESGNIVSYPTRVWTGSLSDGTRITQYSASCSGWTSGSSGSGGTGDISLRDTTWATISPPMVGCANLHRLYCVEQ